MTLEEKIKEFRENPTGIDPFIHTTTMDIVDHLHVITKKIYNNKHLFPTKKMKKFVGDMLLIGKSLSFFLHDFSPVTRTILEHIEYEYGISFSSLKIYNEVIKKSTNEKYFIFYNPRQMFPHFKQDTYTLMKNGERFFIPIKSFDNEYKNVKY